MNRTLFCLFFGVALLFSGNASAQINIFNVSNGDVAGLRNAITTSNSDGEDDIINLANNGTYTLTNADASGFGFPTIAFDNGHHVTIHGHGSTIQRGSGAPDFSMFVSDGFLSMDNLSLSSGANNIAGIASSGEIDVQNCTFGANNYGLSVGYRAVVTDCTFTSSTALGINNIGTVTVVRGNFQGQEGIVNSEATLTITDSSFTGHIYPGVVNEAVCTNFGCAPSTATVTGCTFSGNSSSTDGGAIDNVGSTLHLTNCTFASNTAAQNGGAVNNAAIADFTPINTYVDSAASVSLVNCTFDGNSATHGGAVANKGGIDPFVGLIPATVTLANTILKSSNGSGGTLYNADGTGSITSNGHNIADDAAGGDGSTGPGGILNQTGDLRNTDPIFISDTPQDYGGPTKTIAIGLFDSSPAINHGDPSYAPRRDQRGYFRTGAPDTGAYEYHGGVIGNITAIQRTGGSLTDITINFEAVDRITYKLERKLNMTDAGWNEIGNELTATGNDIEPIFAPGDVILGKAFYRVSYAAGP